MSVPYALTALLCLQPAYGLQLHKELVQRLPHRAKTNVGQIYSTLDRLQRAEQVALAGATGDGLPLYTSTDQGRATSSDWLAGLTLSRNSEWTEFMDVIALSASIPGTGFSQLQSTLAKLELQRAHGDLNASRQSHLLAAVGHVYEDTAAALASGELTPSDMNAQRPARGRRPKKA